MIRLDIGVIPQGLSEQLAQVLSGEQEGILLFREGVAVAEIRPLPTSRREPRRIGLAKGTFSVPPSFFDPLPEDVLAAFEGDEDPHHSVTTG